MEIIKQGHLPSNELCNIFKCKKCGCIFKADRDEYTYNYIYDTSLTRCPCCSALVEAEGPGTTKEEIETKKYIF